uniref:SET domain-containing protein n=1 Tax=Syphacia muris TaxID=451379 RepID=A0A0N5AA38_9BILA
MEKSRRSRAPIDYALLVSGKGPLNSQLASKARKNGLIKGGVKSKQNKLRKSATKVLSGQNEQNQSGQELSGERSSTSLNDSKNIVTAFANNRAETDTVLIKNTKENDGRLVDEQAFSCFPLLPNSLTSEVVNFSIPQEMIKECSCRRQEAEDESVAFLFEAVRTLHDRDPLTFRQKYAVLNHLFEGAPERTEIKKSEKAENCEDEKIQYHSNVEDNKERIVVSSTSSAVTSTSLECSTANSDNADLKASVKEKCVNLPCKKESEAGNVVKNVKELSGTDKVRSTSGRPRGRPRRLPKNVLAPLTDMHHLNSSSTKNVDNNHLPVDKLASNGKSERPVRRRTISGFYRLFEKYVKTYGCVDVHKYLNFSNTVFNEQLLNSLSACYQYGSNAICSNTGHYMGRRCNVDADCFSLLDTSTCLDTMCCTVPTISPYDTNMLQSAQEIYHLEVIVAMVHAQLDTYVPMLEFAAAVILESTMVFVELISNVQWDIRVNLADSVVQQRHTAVTIQQQQLLPRLQHSAVYLVSVRHDIDA